MDPLENEAKIESKLLKLALSNKQIATAVLGQALLDEGGIGAQSIRSITHHKMRQFTYGE